MIWVMPKICWLMDGWMWWILQPLDLSRPAPRYAATSGGRRLSSRRMSTTQTAQRETCSAIITMSSLRGLARCWNGQQALLRNAKCCIFCMCWCVDLSNFYICINTWYMIHIWYMYYVRELHGTTAIVPFFHSISKPFQNRRTRQSRIRCCLQSRDCPSEDEQCTLGPSWDSTRKVMVIFHGIFWEVWE